jgi:hypothetical protein
MRAMILLKDRGSCDELAKLNRAQKFRKYIQLRVEKDKY